MLWRRRQADQALQVFWVQRSPQLRFMGGWHAFPGGALDPEDPATELDGNPSMSSEEGDRFGPHQVPGLAAAALRELFEETGVLPTADFGPKLGERLRKGLSAARHQLLDHGGSLSAALQGLGVQPRATELVFAGRWRTPPQTPVRFDNRFFLLHWPSSAPLQPEILPGELVSGEWITPQEALDAWRHGRVITAPPILHILRVLASHGPEEGLPQLRSADGQRLGSFRRFEFRPGVITLPLITPTLPPAAHTNAFLLGHGETVLVDPGSSLPEQQEALLEALEEAAFQGRAPRAIWLTHHHPDHIGAVATVRRAFGLPVLAHPATAQRLLAHGITVDDVLEAGQTHHLQGEPSMEVRVLHTPGHAPGHLCFFDAQTGSLLAGDLVAGLGTIVIDPPDGEMAHYLESLQAIADLDPLVLFPAHGPPLHDGRRQLLKLLKHRRQRERRIQQAHAAGHTTLDALLPEVYPDLDPLAAPLARRQILAHLLHLGLAPDDSNDSGTT